MICQALTCVVLGCGADELLSSPSPIAEEGQPCVSLERTCANDTQLLVCSRFWSLVDCAAVCASSGRRLLGCVLDEGPDRCACLADEEDQCLAGDTVCGGPETLLRCDAEGRFTELDCPSLCAEKGMQSLGCGATITGQASCSCSLEGGGCSPDGVARCDGRNSLLRCDQGVWASQDCQLSCPRRNGSCRSPVGPAQPRCECEPGLP